MGAMVAMGAWDNESSLQHIRVFYGRTSWKTAMKGTNRNHVNAQNLVEEIESGVKLQSITYKNDETTLTAAVVK